MGKALLLKLSKAPSFPSRSLYSRLISEMGILLIKGWPHMNSPAIPKVTWCDLELESNLKFMANEMTWNRLTESL